MEDELILSEEDRLKLDEIVSQMTQNNESDESIQFVVEDFKSKYGVKKKDSDLPVQEEVTESITEAQATPTSSESSLDPNVFREMTTEEKVATRQGTPYEDTEEKDTLIERALGKNAVTDLLGDMYRAGATGYQQGQSVDEALEVLAKGSSVSDQDVEEYIAAVQETGPYTESDEMKDFYKAYNEEGQGIFGVLKGLYNNPGILPEVLVSSTASMMNPATAAGGAAGAAGGAAVGSTGFSLGPLGVFTTLGGAISGFFGGATTTLETAMTFNELLREELGEKEFNKENVKAVLNDPEKLSSLRFRAVGRGATIGTIDAMTAGLAGAVTKKLVKAGVKKSLAGVAGGGVEMVGGSLGEVGGKAVAGQEMDVADIALEGVAGLGSAPLTVGAKLLSRNKPTYKLNGENVTKEFMLGFVNQLSDENISNGSAKIEINNDPEVKGMLESRLEEYSLNKDIPGNITNPETRTKLVELEKERKSLENNTTQSAKNRVIEIDNQIKNLQQDAIQEQETGDILDAEPAESVQEVEEEVREPSIETEEKIKIKSKSALDPVTKETIDSYELEGEEKENRLNFVEKQIEKDIQEEKSVKEIVQGIEKRLNLDKESKNKVTLYITDRVNKKTTQSFSEWNNSKPTPTEQTTEQEVKVYDNINDDLEVFGEFTKNVESGRDFGNLPGEVQNIIDLGQRLDEQGVTVEVTRDLGIVDGRQILEVTASNGEKFLMYKSKGTGTGAASKGKWVPLPGFAKDGYFIKGAFNPETGKTFIPTGPLSEVNNPKFNKYGSETFRKLAEQLESETTIEETPILQTVEEDIIIYKGTGGKRDAAGNLKTRHPGAKGSFFSADKNIAETYKGEGEVVEDVIPAGATIEEIEIDTKGLTPEQFNKAEEDAINASEADVVKLTTIENRGKGTMKEVQYIVKKKPSIDVKPEEALGDVFLSTGKKIKDTIEAVKRRLFTARRFLPKVFYDIIKNKDAQIQGDMDVVASLNRDYNKIIESVKDDKEKSELEKKADKLLRGEEVEIREDLREVITSMREMIDDLSRKLLLDPTISPESKAKIESNLGSYLTRSYEKYDSKNWKTQVSDDVLNSAKEYLREQQKRKNPEATNERIEELVELDIQDILEGKEGSNFIFGKEVKGKDVKSMTGRKDIPIQIRMLMGEYTDVAQNFAKSIIKLSSQTNTSQMLRDIRNVGLQTGILKTEDQRTKEFNTEIKSEGSKAFEEIGGLYTTPEIAEEFNRMVEQKPESPLLNIYFNIVGANKYMKTILSPATHAVNFVSNMGFAAVNGYGDVRELKNAYQSFRNITRGKNFNREMYNKYVRLGIIDKSVGLQEVKELFSNNDFESAILRNIDSKGNNLATRMFKKFKGTVEQTYQAEDDFWKIYSFEHELDRYSQAEYGKKPSELTESELSKVEKIAADNVKKIMPSYDQIPDIIKKFRSVPIVGSFVSFQYESYRTAINTIKLAQKELASKNPQLRKSGAKRLAGGITYISGRNALLASYGKMAGLGVAGIIGSAISDDDEKDRKSLAKRYLMEWQKESDILPLNIKDGKFEIIDISGSDPHGAINKTINAMSESESVEDAALKLFVEAVYKPFAGGDMTANLLLELKENKKPSGAPIYNEEDLPTIKWKKQAAYAYNKLQPGFTKQIGQVVDSENKLKRIGGMLTGLKQYEFDIPKAFKYKSQAFGYGRKLPNIKKAYKKNIIDKSPEEIDNLYEDYNKNYVDAIRNMHLDYRAARDVFGVSNKELIKIMKENGISMTIIKQIIKDKPINLPKNPNVKAKKSSSSAIRAF